MERVLEPEWLDELPSTDRQARRSRIDLRRVNRIMGHAGFIARELRARPVPRRICDIGGGDGALMLRVAQKTGWRGVELTIVDRKNIAEPEILQQFHRLHWRVTVEEQDVFDALANGGSFDAFIANLFLHHFTRDQLVRLLSLVAGRSVHFIACEPRRFQFAGLAGRSLALIGCNRVTRHDAVASVRAGFRNRELSELWRAAGWELDERERGLFSHWFVARRQ